MTGANRYIRWYASAIGLTLLALVPLVHPAIFQDPPGVWSHGRSVIGSVLFLLSILAWWLALNDRRFSFRERLVAVVLAGYAAAYCEVLHFWIVDMARDDPAFPTNTQWEKLIHHLVLLLTGAEPHSYRFLPNSIVAWLQWLTGDFVLSRVLYRVLADGLLFCVVYRLARLYLRPLCSVGVVIVLMLCYPLTILNYNGQFTDPASHLSFALCFYCILGGYEPALGPAIVIGALAKESVIIMGICRWMAGNRRGESVMIGSLYLVAGAAVAFLVRRHVQHGPIPFRYSSISGTQASQVFGNLGVWRRWLALYLVTVGALLPGAVYGWRFFDRTFRFMGVVVFSASLLSNLFISLMWELRNMVPALILLAVVNLKTVEYLIDRANPRAAAEN